MIKLRFPNKQYDGSYEVSGVELNIQGEIMKGLLYFPPERFSKPYPLIIYFHGFPQLFSLQDIVKKEQFLLEKGYSLLVCNFRGYRYSEGTISLKSHYKDGLKLVEFVQKMSKKGIFEIQNLNILAHDFGGYVALLISAQTDFINKSLLLFPILDLSKHIQQEGFLQQLEYIKRFLPGNIRGIENIGEFIKKTKEELKNPQYQINEAVKVLKLTKLKIIIGKEDKLTSLEEVEEIFKESNKNPEIIALKNIGHQTENSDQDRLVNDEIQKFF
ncbi:MAG: hypothetical protein BAJALOKI2v1_50090 [Promethearchaeota archaeon]|nr:MAG: hypothetical protein BAJALOKI2v1_50090 [Candidatus Lokiarchaeota archaeon]